MATTVYEVPLSPIPQFFSINIGGSDFVLTFTYNNLMKYWVMDIANAGSVPLVTGIPLITGANLTAKYAYLKLPSFFTQTTYSPDTPPTLTNLGRDAKLYSVITTPESLN